LIETNTATERPAPVRIAVTVSIRDEVRQRVMESQELKYREKPAEGLGQFGCYSLKIRVAKATAD